MMDTTTDKETGTTLSIFQILFIHSVATTVTTISDQLTTSGELKN